MGRGLKTVDMGHDTKSGCISCPLYTGVYDYTKCNTEKSQLPHVVREGGNELFTSNYFFGLLSPVGLCKCLQFWGADFGHKHDKDGFIYRNMDATAHIPSTSLFLQAKHFTWAQD